jgi:quaternary ammonium compound-resistance protein SugE
MAWFILIVAGLLEVVWAVGLKASDGFTKLWPTVVTVVGLAVSMALLAWAMRSLPMGTAYAVWTGIGIVGTAILGIVYFHEPANLGRLACIGLILAGIAGLRFLSPA